MEPLTFVTPVFEAEVELLRLQARSFAVHVPPTTAAAVVVLDNTRRGLRDPDGLRAAYGPLADRVRVLRPRDVRPLPPAPGWRAQQVLKLAVAEQVTTRRYVALDAKNHFVAPPPDTCFVSADDRARVRGYGYRTHPLRPSLEHVLRYLGLDPAEHLDRFAATVTPFVLDTALVREVVADVERTSGRPFEREFLAQDLTEFFLYAGWLLRRDGTLDRVLELTEDRSPTLWPRAADVDGVAAAVAATADVPILGLHRNAVPLLDADAVRALATFWADRGLVEDVAAGEAVVATMRAAHRRERRRQQVRDVPGRAATLARRVRRRVVRH